MSQLSKSPVRRSADSPARAATPKATPTPRHAGPLSLERGRRLGHRVDRLAGAPPIQTKLTLGPADDVYEQEADAVAKDVVNQIASPSAETTGGEGGASTSVQRDGGDEMGDMLAQRVQRDDMPDDEMLAKRVQRDDMPDDEMLAKRVQRDDMPDDEMLAKRVQRDADVQRDSLDGGPVGSDVESTIESSRGGGSPIDDTVRGPMEDAFDADFSGVNVHTDPQADTLNRQLDARAFTTGQDVFFRQGEYQPGSRDGQELLAHELTHVVQQNGDAVRQGGD